MLSGKTEKTRHIHMTDIFHPHGDPDDHYDLALVFALHKAGLLNVERILMDYPPAHRAGDPALCANAQLNDIFGLDIRADVMPEDISLAGDRIVRILENSDVKMTFSVVGTTQNIADAIKKAPAVFKKKCAGIYLVAGTGIETEGGALEYNVRLHPEAYSATLNAPCPVYWTPCYHTILPPIKERGGEYSCVYAFYQKEVLESLPEVMKKYFLYMLTRSSDPKYLRYLREPVDEKALEEFGNMKRRLWSTPAILRAAGVGMETAEFLPVKVHTEPDGHTSWTHAAEEETDKFILHIRAFDAETDDTFDTGGSYKKEMTKKLIEYLNML